jgi:GntR family transcriptional regulator
MTILKKQENQMAQASLTNRPLYVQVREILLERISSGAWRPGDLIPNEFAVASELGVSQGTVRKALDSLAADRLVIRRQGRGTHVAQHTPDEVLFRFFNFVDENGEPIRPGLHSAKLVERSATREEQTRLSLGDGARVFRIKRLRTNGDTPFILEKISLPVWLFPALGEERNLPNTLYDYFQKACAVTVARGDERLTVAKASADQAGILGILPGTPLLKIDRVMYSLQNQPVEWRVSLCWMKNTAYAIQLR